MVKQPKEPSPVGIFDPRLIYTGDAVKQMTGWGEWAFRQNRRRGLKTKTVGKTVFVRGCDLVAFVEAVGEDE